MLTSYSDKLNIKTTSSDIYERKPMGFHVELDSYSWSYQSKNTTLGLRFVRSS